MWCFCTGACLRGEGCAAKPADYSYSASWPWPSYRCPRCGSVMLDNEAWEDHLRSHARIDAEAAPGTGAPSGAVTADTDTVRMMLAKGERQDELLDGREFTFGPWREAYQALARLVAALAAAEQDLTRIANDENWWTSAADIARQALVRLSGGGEAAPAQTEAPQKRGAPDGKADA